MLGLKTLIHAPNMKIFGAQKFLCKYISSSSVLCRLFASTAADECGKVLSVLLCHYV